MSLIKVAYANISNDTVVNSLVTKITENIINPLLYLLSFLTIIIFVWGLFGFFTSAEDAKKREEGRQHILWGVIGMTIMISVYGIIRLVANTVGQSGALPGGLQ